MHNNRNGCAEGDFELPRIHTATESQTRNGNAYCLLTNL